MKVLFLDVDGVLNSTRSAVGLGGIPHDTAPEQMGLFDLTALGLIRNLCKETGASIVLSSTWRLSRNPVEMGRALSLPIIDKTPHFGYSKCRGTEIADWLSKNPVDKYAIVDDDSDMLPEQMPFFVKTTFENGLLWEHYKQLIQLL